MEVGEWGGCDKPCQLATTKRVGGGGKKPGAGQVIPATISPHCQCPHQTYSYSSLKGEWLSASITLNGHLTETPFFVCLLCFCYLRHLYSGKVMLFTFTVKFNSWGWSPHKPGSYFCIVFARQQANSCCVKHIVFVFLGEGRGWGVA